MIITAEGASGIRRVAAETRQWLFEQVLPFWSEHGLDPAGGFHDQLAENGAALALPKRCRVQTRQIYVFATAGRIGWQGPWQQCVDHGMAFLMRAFVREDGLLRSKVAGPGDVVDDTADNYDQAFGLFALAQVFEQTGDPAIYARAEAMLARLRAERSHPRGGFYEHGNAVPLRSNPHMHFFEACLAWMDVSPAASFREVADEIASLALELFIEPNNGALREYFDLDWMAQAGPTGRIVEPGHQFEWAWLLARWHIKTPAGDAPRHAANRLHTFATRYGIDRGRNVAIDELWVDGTIKDANARLWPQTERLKAVLAIAELAGHGDAADVTMAWKGLEQYRLPGDRALFRDKLARDGHFIAEPAFASSLYHIVCAIAELDRVARAGHVDWR